MQNISVEEIRIKVTYGTIAGKWWGRKNQRPIIAIHGWQDNAGSFDTLIPLLPSNFSYLCIDLPGHGFSSHISKGQCYHVEEIVLILQEIRTKFNWNRVSLMAHSLGVVAAFMFAALYPSHVDLVCALDVLRPVSLKPSFVADTLSYRWKNLCMLPANVQPFEYTYDEVVERMSKGSLGTLKRDKIKYLMKRGTKPSSNDPNKLQIARDIRIKYMNPLFMEHEVTMILITKIQAAYLFIKTDDRTYAEPRSKTRQAVDQFQKYNNHFEMVRVAGNHHLHLNEPEKIAPKIADFLTKYHRSEINRFNETSSKSKL